MNLDDKSSPAGMQILPLRRVGDYEPGTGRRDDECGMVRSNTSPRRLSQQAARRKLLSSPSSRGPPLTVACCSSRVIEIAVVADCPSCWYA